MTFDWNDQSVVEAYSRLVEKPGDSWYEDEVNVPAILELLPRAGVRLLDFGCGPGNFTELLSKQYDASGSDASEAMVEFASQRFPQITFFQWGALGKLPKGVAPYDVIVTKLTLEFVSDLRVVARHLHRALKPGGLLVFSVQHPLLAISAHPEMNIPYWQSPMFDVQLGKSGHTVTKVHRNLQSYIMPFLENGFKLTAIDEPEIPKGLSEKHPMRPIDFKVPKRLNAQFQAV